MGYESMVEEQFPSIEQVSDASLRAGVVEVWANALDQSEYEDVRAVPWAPAFDPYLGNQRLVDIVRDTVRTCLGLTDAVEGTFGFEVDRDVVIVGALVQNVSKVVETRPHEIYSDSDRDADTEIGKLVQHPHFALSLLEEAGMPVEVQHIAISHSSRTPVDPATIEARIVRTGDTLAANGRFLQESGELMPPHDLPWEDVGDHISPNY